MAKILDGQLDLIIVVAEVPLPAALVEVVIRTKYQDGPPNVIELHEDRGTGLGRAGPGWGGRSG